MSNHWWGPEGKTDGTKRSQSNGLGDQLPFQGQLGTSFRIPWWYLGGQIQNLLLSKPKHGLTTGIKDLSLTNAARDPTESRGESTPFGAGTKVCAVELVHLSNDAHRLADGQPVINKKLKQNLFLTRKTWQLGPRGHFRIIMKPRRGLALGTFAVKLDETCK